jgi:hypothetical protein
MSRWSRRLRYGPPIVIVSGLPRSGTSMAMKMLHAGGLPLLTDGARQADANNPEGYFELEAVKRLDKPGDLLWLRGARGRGLKVISWLLTWLPETYNYRVIFMQRDLDEVIASQNAMLLRRGEADRVGDAAATREAYATHLEQVGRFLARRSCFTTMAVGYRTVIEQPAAEASRIARFLGRPLDVGRMAAAVDPGLYRSRSAERR